MARHRRAERETDAIALRPPYTSAGATAGLDLAATLVEEDFGAEFARKVSQGLVMYLKRPGNQAQLSVHLSARFPEEERLRSVLAHIAENPAAGLGVETLAERAGMSPRNFSRVFTREVGMTPGCFVERSRVEHARHLLETTGLRVGEVANRCGYASADGLRLAFERLLDVTPRQYRGSFASSQDSVAVL